MSGFFLFVRSRVPGLSAVACLLILGACQARAGLFDPIDVRAQSTDPTQADHPGYVVYLSDFHSTKGLVLGGIKIPDSFGKVDVAVLNLVGSDGKALASQALASSKVPLRDGTTFDLEIARDCLQNSTLAVSNSKGDEPFDVAVIHLGTFEVHDRPRKDPVTPPPVQLALVEGGVYDENGDFTVTNQVSQEPGASFGLRMVFRGKGRSVRVRIEQTLPESPPSWGDPADLRELTISGDGRTATASKTLPTGELIEGPRWVVADGEPIGDYVYKIFSGDKLLREIVFHVKPASKSNADAEKAATP